MHLAAFSGEHLIGKLAIITPIKTFNEKEVQARRTESHFFQTTTDSFEDDFCLTLLLL
jgi:hypothetical protein